MDGSQAARRPATPPHQPLRRRCRQICQHLVPKASRGTQSSAAASGAAGSAVGGKAPSLVADLQALATLRTDHMLSEDEYTTAKAQLLSAEPRRQHAVASRASLPQRIILLRHGESEGNADNTLYRSKPDNLIELTARGRQQATAAGKHIAEITAGGGKIEMYTSPFLRTVQTARTVFGELPEDQVFLNHIDPRIREQEFGNMQDESFSQLREDQKLVGRFWCEFLRRLHHTIY